MPMDRQHQSSPPQRKSEGTAVSQQKPVQAASSPVPMQQHLMQLQRTAGNRAVMQWMASRRQTAGQASALSRPPIQMRGANPYAYGGGTTSHHIIPHSVLMHNLNLLDAGQQVSVMGNFLPQFDRLTLETVIKASIENDAGEALAITYEGQSGTLGNVEADAPAGFQAVARTPFANLTQEQQQLIKFDGKDFGAFRQEYLLLKGGQVRNPNDKEMSLLKVFYEWQSGNQFYGPDRYEPGDKDGFDADATHVLGDEGYVGGLRRIYDKLKPNQQGKVKSLNDQQKTEMVETLNSLANLGSQDRRIPENNSSDWVRLDSDVKEQVLAVIEGYNRVQASGIQGARKDHYRVHKGIVRAHLAKLQGKAENRLDAGHWRAMIHFLNGKQGVADPSPLDYPMAGSNCKVSVSGNQLVISISGFEAKETFEKSNGRQYVFKDLYKPLDDLITKYAGYLRTLFEL